MGEGGYFFCLLCCSTCYIAGCDIAFNRSIRCFFHMTLALSPNIQTLHEVLQFLPFNRSRCKAKVMWELRRGDWRGCEDEGMGADEPPAIWTVPLFI